MNRISGRNQVSTSEAVWLVFILQVFPVSIEDR